MLYHFLSEKIKQSCYIDNYELYFSTVLNFLNSQNKHHAKGAQFE